MVSQYWTKTDNRSRSLNDEGEPVRRINSDHIFIHEEAGYFD